MASTFDAIIIGGGHNGLVAACYLARVGWKTLVLERYSIVGGACVTEEVFPGYRVSTAAYVNSLLRPEIIRDLKLESFGYELLLRDPSSFSPFPGNRHLIFWRDPAATKEEIARFSTRDADRYAAYEAHLEDVVQVIEPMLLAPPPNLGSWSLGELLGQAKLGLRLRRRAEDLVRLFSSSAADYLDRWFESDELKVRLASDGVIGAMAGPRTPGTAYVLFHHVMGQSHGQRGVWGYVKGGMGTITQGMAKFLKNHRGVIETNAEVHRVVVKNNRVTGVVLTDGREYTAKTILSSCDPKRTFLGMFEELDLPEGLVADVKAIRMRSGSAKINIAASGLPDFVGYRGTEPGPQHRGTIHFCPSMDAMERAYDDAKWGRPSSQPVVEMTIPSVIDPSLAPPGKHLISLFVQYCPYERADGRPWNEETNREFAESVSAVLREYILNWDDIVDDMQILTPKGIEDRFGLTGGNIFHGEMTLDQMLHMRPTPSTAHYATPLDGFYLCGSGCHPGGGVLGSPGYLAAARVLRERSR